MEAPIVLFDGVCHFCNYWVSFLLKNETTPRIVFSPQQSEFAQLIATQYSFSFSTIDSIVFIDNEKVYLRSAAVFQLLLHVRYPWKALRLFRWLPRFVTDALYRLVAKIRYRWFGKSSECKIYPKEVQHRFK